MRVALLNPRPQRRGGELFSRQLAEELRRRGHDLLEIYLYPPAANGALARAPGEIHLGSGSDGWLERLAGWDPRIGRGLRRELARFAPEILQVSGGKTVKYAALALGRGGSKPLLVYRSIGEPGVWLRGSARRWFYSRLVLPRVTAVATVARSFVPRLERMCPNARIVRCIPGGVDRQRLEPTESRERVRELLETARDSAVVLFAGGLTAEKRVDRLLRAFAAGLWRLPAATLWIAGSGDLDARLRALAADLGIEHRVRFLGARADVGNLISASDLVALTSDTEGVPAILQEASALGRAVVATRAGATAEAITDGETGLLVDRENERGLSQALFDLLADDDRRRRMGAAAARDFAASALSIEAAAEAYERLYLEALGRWPGEEEAL